MTLSPMLHQLALLNAPRLIISLRPQDPLPDWITHLIYLDQDCKVARQGLKKKVLDQEKGNVEPTIHMTLAHYRRDTKERFGKVNETQEQDEHEAFSTEQSSLDDRNGDESQISLLDPRSLGEARYDGTSPHGNNKSLQEVLVKMEGVRVRYGDKVVLGNWTQGQGIERTEGLWWTVRRGERWGIFGPNGRVY